MTLFHRVLIFFGVVGTAVNLVGWALLFSVRDRLSNAVPRTIPSAYGENPSAETTPFVLETIFRMRHAQNLMNAIAQSPTEEAFRQRIAGAPIGARFESPRGSWSTSDDVPTAEHALATGEALYPFKGFRVTPTLVAKDDGNVRWVVRYPENWGVGMRGDPRLIVGLLLNTVTVLIVGALFYFFQLKPLLQERAKPR